MELCILYDVYHDKIAIDRKSSVTVCLTVIVMFVPLDIGDHAGHVHRAQEARRVAHGQAHVLRGLQDVGEAAHFY